MRLLLITSRSAGPAGLPLLPDLAGRLQPSDSTPWTILFVLTLITLLPAILMCKTPLVRLQDSFELLTNDSEDNFPECGTTGRAIGITVCSPGTSSSSPVKFSIGAAGPTPMRTVAVWADGKKVAEQLTHAFAKYSFLDASVALSSRSHSDTVNGIGCDNTHQSRSFTLTVSGTATCATPYSSGINVCSPAENASTFSPLQINARATVSGGVYRFELWSGSTKLVFVANSGVMNQAVSLAPTPITSPCCAEYGRYPGDSYA